MGIRISLGEGSLDSLQLILLHVENIHTHVQNTGEKSYIMAAIYAQIQILNYQLYQFWDKPMALKNQIHVLVYILNRKDSRNSVKKGLGKKH